MVKTCHLFLVYIYSCEKKKRMPCGQSSTSSRGFSLISPCQPDESWKIIIPCFSAWLSCLSGKPQGVTVSMDSVVLCGLWLSSSVSMAGKDKKSFKTRKVLCGLELFLVVPSPLSFLVLPLLIIQKLRQEG